ncbi:saccharopine dehydrogenase family protein [Zooshikella harenae]|uniref:Saccharopine dehydrogenase NADP-binding domain-containing protein n=1 Tax=Zooshikella harenae TaxID=2827238 RepID=A0ABS5ZAE5_9GAMM|nr:saccharopine dehydrogenase NADP-binding domain-containing protein [Zooshikella harenae]MBU2711019.1 saccharopine dehydrogenase NADP-binding domain-containing protein [Zooshikella harenae]
MFRKSLEQLSHSDFKELLSGRKCLLYGANGYTGTLVARKAHALGLTPILAGRQEQFIVPLATELGCSYRIFNILKAEEACEQLNDVDVLINCAGPFPQDTTAIIQSCLANTVHYLDINGDLATLVNVQRFHTKAQETGVVLCPGVGFDVIPTDCIAATLKHALPDAVSLSLGFEVHGKLSPGSVKTLYNVVANGCQIRQNGLLTPVPFGYHMRHFDEKQSEKMVTAIPWGDLASAYFSTQIPNIECLYPIDPEHLPWLKRLRWFRGLLKLPWLKKLAYLLISSRFQTPTPIERQQSATYFWGEVKNSSGLVKRASLKAADGYDLTVAGVLLALQFLLNYAGDGGYFTPSQLMGRNCVESLPNTSNIRITTHSLS